MRIRILGTRPAPSSIRSQLPRPARGRGPIEHVQRREIPYWQERGWHRQGNVYHGSYQTPYGAVRGMVEDHGRRNLRFYMFEPPPEVRRSAHWACFQPRGNKGYHVHMGTRPADVSSGIMTIENDQRGFSELKRS